MPKKMAPQTYNIAKARVPDYTTTRELAVDQFIEDEAHGGHTQANKPPDVHLLEYEIEQTLRQRQDHAKRTIRSMEWRRLHPRSSKPL